ncbi:MAG TPA: apolipoprotein N-acyltransferase, partial [Trueperaceae bacterium]|nr:apolipoprotein N-acyltransferase [Trueperaceae bacterium]
GRRAFSLGFWFGLPFFAIYVSWLPRSLAVALGPSFWFVFPILVIALACFWGLTTWATWTLSGGGGRRTLFLLPVTWVLVEWARTQGYFAFPWGTLGYLWLDTPVAQLASSTGLYGLSLLVTVPAALAALPLVTPRTGSFGDGVLRLLLAPATALVLLAAAFMIGQDRLPAAAAVSRAASTVVDDVAGLPSTPPPAVAQPYSALLVQGNSDAFGRLTNARSELDTHLGLTTAAVTDRQSVGLGPFDLVVWPEGAVLGFEFEGRTGADLRQVISDSTAGAPIVVGGRAYVEDASYNSLFSLENGNLVDRYDKHYLVPFGERWPFIEAVPWLYRAVFTALGLPMLSGTTAGATPTPLTTSLAEVGAYICYESVFPQVQRQLVAGGARLLVLSTNDAWFAVGAGARQHFDMGRLRAIETRRWLLRAGNDGITAAVDPYGRVTAELPRGVAATLAVGFDLRDELTNWVRFGTLTPWLLGGYVVLVGVALLRARPKERVTAADRLLKRSR